MPHENLDEAANWFAARRRAVMTLGERAAQDEWLRKPENAMALARLEQDWNALDGLEPWLGLNGSTAQSGPATRTGRAAMFAAMCAVTLAFGLMSYGGNSTFWTALDWSNR